MFVSRKNLNELKRVKMDIFDGSNEYIKYRHPLDYDFSPYSFYRGLDKFQKPIFHLYFAQF